LAGKFDLGGKRAVVTGASRGLGQAIARDLAEAGCDLVITARRAKSLGETAALVRGFGRKVVCLGLDVTETARIEPVFAEAAAALGGIDILVNNAGYEEVRASSAVDAALWDRIVDTNLKGAFFCAQAAAGHMTGGAIVNLCSLTSYVGVPTAVAYGASKSGLLGMTRALAAEWAGRGIRVNAIAPGYFRTAMTEGFYQDEGWQAAMLAKIPQGRFGRAEDVGGAVVFLASDAAAYITGQCLPIDGGYLASI
jgi:NAD(P)-dependent dehydrogenase (short-subunit alcohol dehydrogenase family)